MSNNEALTCIAPGDGESILVMTDLVTVKVRGQNSGERFALTEVLTPPRGGPPLLHRHRDAETFYILEGSFRFDTLQDGQIMSIEAAPGSVVHIPSLVWHNYKNITATHSKMMVVLQPGEMIDFFRELGVPATGETNTPRPSGPPDMHRVMEIQEKHHVESLNLPVKM